MWQEKTIWQYEKQKEEEKGPLSFSDQVARLLLDGGGCAECCQISLLLADLPHLQHRSSIAEEQQQSGTQLKIHIHLLSPPPLTFEDL